MALRVCERCGRRFNSPRRFGRALCIACRRAEEVGHREGARRPARPGRVARVPARGIPSRRRPVREVEAGPRGIPVWIWIGGGAAALLLAVGLVLLLQGGEDRGRGGKAGPSAKAPAAPGAAAKAEREKARRELARREIEACEAEIAASPDAYEWIAYRYERLAERFPDLRDVAAELRRKAEENRGRASREAEATLEEIEKEADHLCERRAFEEAAQLYRVMPPAIRGRSDLQARFTRRAEELASLEKGARRLADLRKRAFEYQKRGDFEIAEQIITIHFSGYEDTPLGAMRDELLNEIRVGKLDPVLAAEDKARREREAREARRRAEEERLREEKWRRGKEAIPYVNLLGPYDIMNWPIRFPPGAWKHTAEGDVGILEADNRRGQRVAFIGPHAPHWQDFVVRLEFRIGEGSFQVSPRTVVRPFMFGGFRPDRLGTTDPPVVFEKGEFGGDWVRAVVEVHGTRRSARVRLLCEKPSIEREWKGDEIRRLPDAGGFLLLVPQGAHVVFRRVELKLVHHTRESIFSELERGGAKSG